jgi:hypothetical protein
VRTDVETDEEPGDEEPKIGNKDEEPKMGRKWWLI